MKTQEFRSQLKDCCPPCPRLWLAPKKVWPSSALTEQPQDRWWERKGNSPNLFSLSWRPAP